MVKVILGLGAIQVENAPQSLREQLTYWKREISFNDKTHRRDVSGRYEKLYSESGQTLTTMPGFAHRIFQHLRKLGTAYTVDDRRLRMPKQEIERACEGLRDYQLEPAITTLIAGGGILSLPTGYGKTRLAAALIRAYDHEDLISRGTPISVFSAPDKDINQKNWEEFRKIFPDRDVGLVMSGKRKFSDDIQIITLDSLHLLDPEEVGILIVDEVHTAGAESRAESISRFHKAIRWGVSATPGGRFDGGDLVLEGLFGPVVCKRTYQDAVKLGALVPISVFWMKAPPPACGMGRYLSYTTRDWKIKAGIISNPDYSRMVASVMRTIPSSKSVLCFTQFLEQMANIHAFCPEVEYVHAQTKDGLGSIKAISPKDRKSKYDRMASGEIRKMLATFCWKQGVSFDALDIVVNASGGGSDIVAKQMPGRASRKADGKDRAYVVDFIHEWDRDKDGKPGPLLSGDLSRKRSYRELGFDQTVVESMNELPFIKEQP